jgi:hypothetical protein
MQEIGIEIGKETGTGLKDLTGGHTSRKSRVETLAQTSHFANYSPILGYACD